jgi:ubiquitin thioesterase OTU1
VSPSSTTLPTRLLTVFDTVKSGYPLRPLTLVPELPIDSLDIKHGDQIIVSELTTHEIVRDSPRPPPVAPSTHPYYIDVDGSVLVHRVILFQFTFTIFRLTSLAPQIVPDDNSCLFSSVALIFEQSIQKASQMRKSAYSASAAIYPSKT